jgi:hypothetical protein
MANQVLYGFHALRDVFKQRVSNVNIQVINQAVDQSLQEHNRQIGALLALLVQSVPKPTLRYKQGGIRRLQPLDQNGRPLPTRSGQSYDVAFPIQMGGDALGQNFVARAKMTVQEVNDQLADMMVADKRWMRDHILAALYTNTTWSYVDDDTDNVGTLTIQPLANGDTVKYLQMVGADAGAVDTHYLAQASSIDDSHNPFTGYYTELTEHPENGGEVVSLVPTNLISSVEALDNFVPVRDVNVQLGANASQLVGELGVQTPGVIRGYVDKCWISEWRSLPNDYIISTMTEGNRPVGMREDAEPELQGFKRVAEEEDFPYYESIYIRRAGFGGLNRVGAVVGRISNGAYAIPTNYTAPIG